MKIFTRPEIRQLLPERNLKAWCKDHGLYYHGVIRFLGGGEYSAYSYFRLMSCTDEMAGVIRETTHYLATRLSYADLFALDPFLKEILW